MSHILIGAAGLISLLSIVLGFAALLKQKVYLDKETSQPVEIQLPILGRLKTNYPALVFVFLGFFLMLYTVNKVYPPAKVNWHLEGRLKTPVNLPADSIDFRDGDLHIEPALVRSNISKKGKYTIRLELDEGVSVEKAIKFIDYSHEELGSAQFVPNTEYMKFKTDPAKSLLAEKDDIIRKYKTLVLED